MSLPQYVKQGMQDQRHSDYVFNNNLYTGNHYKVFNHDEQEKKLHSWEYLCYGILKQAVTTKSDLIWHELPLIKFDKPRLQKEWDELRLNTNFDLKMYQATNYLYVYGDSLVKIGVDENNETAEEDDLQVSLYLQSPNNWYPEYDPFNPMRSAKANSILFKKEITTSTGVVEGSAYLLETHIPGKIIWTAYFEKQGSVTENEAEQVPLLRYFADELDGIVANGEVNESSFIAEYDTNCTYSLLQRIKNKLDINSYFGQSDFSQPVISKIQALNNYANLADVIIVTNSFPKLILSEKAGNILTRIIEEFNYGRDTNSDITNPGDLLQSPDKAFLNKKTYAESFIYRKLVDEMKAFVDGSEGNTRYLQNDFDLEQIRRQHDIFFKALMSEMDISEVFYNPELSTGAKSGVAYKRLMTQTLNAVETTKRQLEPFIKKTVYTILQLAKQNGLISSQPEMPTVRFYDGIINDESEELANLVTKVQNNFMPLIEAIKIANDVDEKQAMEILDKMDITLQTTKVKQVQDTVEKNNTTTNAVQEE